MCVHRSKLHPIDLTSLWFMRCPPSFGLLQLCSLFMLCFLSWRLLQTLFLWEWNVQLWKSEKLIYWLLFDFICHRSLNDVDAETGILPIHVAIETENIDIVKELIIRNAKLNLADKQGRTVFHYAAKTSNEMIIQVVLTHKQFYTAVNVHSFRLFLFCLFKSTTTQRHVRLQHCVTVNTPNR